MTPELLFHVLVVLVAVFVPTYAWIVRGRTYAIFAAILLALSLPGMLIADARLAALFPATLVPWLHGVFIASIATAGAHMTHLVRARMRSRAFRILVSVPGQTAVAAGFMTGLWLLALLPIRGLLLLLDQSSLLDAMRWLDLAPFFVALASIWTSSRPVTDIVRIPLSREGPSEMTRVRVERRRGGGAGAEPIGAAGRPLRIVQISDPHLGPWQSVRSLQRAIANLLAHEPDLVLLTGDYLTMEGNGSPDALVEALAPLRDREGDCYAILGNHDHEAPGVVRDAMARNRVRLLVDEEAIAETPAGVVQLIGADYVGRGREEHIDKLLARHPRREHHVRLLMLHDPLGFRSIAPGAVDLTLSGHTHGGQVGLLSLGLDWTVLTRTRWPDHGLFAHGGSRLYVHRGTGFYGFPLRVGVPGEASMLELVLHGAPG